MEFTCVVVDDEPAMRHLLSHAVGLFGGKVVAKGENGLAAVELYIRHRPDLLLTDWQMPLMSGLEAARSICLLDSQARILLVSGNMRLEELTLEERNGWSLLEKPFMLEDLRSVLEQSLHRNLVHEVWRERHVA